MFKSRLLLTIGITILLQGSFCAQRAPASADAQKMIDSAIASAANLTPIDRASVIFAAAHALRTSNPAKARQLLLDCFDLVSPMTERDYPGSGFLSGEVVTESAQQFPDHVEQQLPRDNRLQNMALLEIIKVRLRKKDFSRASELLDKLSTEPELELAAQQILNSSPATEKEHAGSILATVLNIHRRIKLQQTALYPEDLGTLNVRYWHDVSPALTEEIIHTLLEESSRTGDNALPATAVVVRGEKARVTVPNMYLYRVLQFLPILDEIDPAEAKTLAEKNGLALGDLQEQAANIAPSKNDTSANRQLAGSGGDSDTGKIADSFDEDQRLEQIANLSRTSPKEGFRFASGISDLPTQIRLLIAIARVNSGDNPETAIESLGRAVEIPIPSDAEPRKQWRLWKEAGELSLELKNAELAKRFANRGFNVAEAISKGDLDKDEPNLAPLLYWPSVQAYRDFLVLLSRVSLRDSRDALAAITNERIQPMENIFLANVLIGDPVWASTSPMVLHRKDVRAE